MAGVARRVVARRVVDWTRAGNDDRKAWWVSFALFVVVTGCWALATPIFGSPDEPAHAIRAVSVVRGQVLGDEPRHEPPNPFSLVPHGLRGSLAVRIPAVWAKWENVDCYIFRKEVTADCLSFAGRDDRDATVYTTAGRHPPAYYAVTGIPSLVWPGGAGAVYLMRAVNVLLTSALLASAVLTVRRTRVPRLGAIGLALAVTPMVLFLSGTVNPSGLEIAAAIALWAGLAVLLREAAKQVDSRLVTRVGVAATVLVLVRSISPFWALGIALVLCLVASRAALRNLLEARVARIWAAVVAAAALAQAVWVLVVGTLDATAFSTSKVSDSTSQIARNVVGKEFRLLREMIGFFGWLDTPAPALTRVLWLFALSGAVVLAVAFGRSAYARAIFAALALTVVVPAITEGLAARDAGYYWQGRYTLPIAVGVPILAGLALSERRLEIPHTGRWVVVAGTSIGVAHVAAFGQALRRYTVGYDGTVLFFTQARWHAPLPALLLLIVFALGIVSLLAWLVGPADAARAAGEPLRAAAPARA